MAALSLPMRRRTRNLRTRRFTLFHTAPRVRLTRALHALSMRRTRRNEKEKLMVLVIAAMLGFMAWMFVSQRRRFAHCWGAPHHGGHGGHGWHGGRGSHGGFGGFRGRGRRERLYELFAELDTTPGQEKAIGRTLEALWERLTEARGELEEAHKQLAAALAGEVLERSALDAALARYRQLAERASAEVAETLASVHEVLDAKQRARLGELIAEGPFGPGWTHRS